jgi:hypothetical protein
MSKIILVEQAAPDIPSTNNVAIYPKSGGGLYLKDDAGTESSLGRIHSGSDTFAGSSGVTVSIGATLGGTTYRVSITPTANSEDVGAIWVASKTTTTFKVHCSGTGTPTFDWLLTDSN